MAIEPNQEIQKNHVRINYFRADQNFNDLGIWVWGDVEEPSSNWPKGAIQISKNPRDSWGFIDLKVKPGARRFGFLVVNRKSGQKDSGNKEVEIKEDMNRFYVKENDDKVYSSPDFDMDYEIVKASIVDLETIKLNFNARPAMTNEDLLARISLLDANKKELKAISLSPGKDSVFFLKTKILPEKTPIVVSFSDKSILATKSWRLIDELYAYEGEDLGCTWQNGSFCLKLWAPKASKVSAVIYDKVDQRRQIAKVALEKAYRGIWTINLDADKTPVADLSGYYYQYEITNHGEMPKLVLDPYAKSMAPVTISPDGSNAGSSKDFVGKAAFVIPEKSGKAPVKAVIKNFSKREDAVIYEVHVRDFTSDPLIESTLSCRWGSFRAFASKLDYIKLMGVTHIQLLPVMAWYFGDETKMNQRELDYCAKNNQFNWGYDPQCYFSPDGAYSLKPEVAQERIAELKFLINEIHKAGMGVILDVVYTHMAKSSFLNDIVPDYYFFQNPEGGFLGDFGNNLATNRKMAQKLMIDSVKYWFNEYKIDGMRWDMMGDATYEAVQNAFNAAKAINPNCVFIGEGWRTFKGHIEDPKLAGKGADQDWMAKTNDVGVFSDEIRNELKSGFGCEGEPRFLTGGRRNIQKLFKNIKGQPDNTPANAPGDMVQYIAAHDNLPLYDVIAQSIKKDPELAQNDLEIHRRIRIGNALILTSQGTAFLHAGQEFGRTKQWLADGKPEDKFHEMTDESGSPFKHPYFIHDSYDSSDAINMFDWSKATNVKKFPNNIATRNYTRGLIAIRRSSDAFRLGSQDLVDKNVTLIPAPEIGQEDLLIAYKCRSTKSEAFLVFVNADNKVRELSIKENLSRAELIADQAVAGLNQIQNPKGVIFENSKLILEPLTVAIFRMK